MKKLTMAMLAGLIASAGAALAMDASFKEDCLGPREETASTPSPAVVTAEPAKPAAETAEPQPTTTAEVPTPKPAAN